MVGQQGFGNFGGCPHIGMGGASVPDVTPDRQKKALVVALPLRGQLTRWGQLKSTVTAWNVSPERYCKASQTRKAQVTRLMGAWD